MVNVFGPVTNFSEHGFIKVRKSIYELSNYNLQETGLEMDVLIPDM